MDPQWIRSGSAVDPQWIRSVTAQQLTTNAAFPLLQTAGVQPPSAQAPSGHAAVQRAHEPSKEGCRGISTYPSGRRRVGRLEPAAGASTASCAGCSARSYIIFQMYFRAQNAEARQLATVYRHKFMIEPPLVVSGARTCA